MQAAPASLPLTLPRMKVGALPCLFILFGLMMGTWAGRIPALRDGLQISHGALSLVLLCGGLGAVLSYPFTSRMMACFGNRKTLLYAGSAILLALLGIGLAPNLPLIMLGVLALGVTASCFDVAVNAVATAQEKSLGKAMLSRMHAWGCAGCLAGVTLSSAMAMHAVSPFLHFALIAVPGALALWCACARLKDEGKVSIEKKMFCLPRGPLALLGALGFCGAVAEGSIADWSGIFLKDHFGTTDGFAPLALTAFSVMMLITRLTGDRLKSRFGARRMLTVSTILAAGGLFFSMSAPNAYLALAGFGVAGLGLALVFPFVFSAAGREGPMALAGVATLTYTGSLMGPPMMGTVAHVVGIQAAIGFVACLAIVIAAIATRTAMLK
jgi:MFS family permease